MNITMTITTETAAELFATIKDAAAKIEAPTLETPAAPIVNPTPAPAAIPANTVPQGVQYSPGIQVPAQIPTPPVTQTAPAALVPPATQSAPARVPNPAVPLTTPPTYTLDQISKAGAELVQNGKMNELLSLLQQAGVRAVTELKPDQIGPFAIALKGLGAAL